MITLRRVQDPPQTPYARRFLIERLWPRDPKGTALHFEGWLKDVAPSPELCNWFGDDGSKWQEFRGRYFSELDARPDAWRMLLEEARHGAVELLYNSGDMAHNNAVALKEYLEAKLAGVVQPA
ncbi:MAG: DUF488 domain-containing protein [Terriglobia bacterium]